MHLDTYALLTLLLAGLVVYVLWPVVQDIATGLGIILTLILRVLWYIIVSIAGIFAFFGDRRHERKVDAGTENYRLPFYLRWSGWKISNGQDDQAGVSGLWYDKKRNRLITTFRPNKR